MKLSAGCLVVAAAITLTACGGGSGSDSTDDGKNSPPTETPNQPEIAAVESWSIDPGDICENGGIAIGLGIDTNNNGTLDTAEITDTRSQCNSADGKEALISTTPEPAGSQCPNAGIRIETGQDNDADKALSSEEVLHTYYICNSSNTGDASEDPRTAFKAFESVVPVDTEAYPQCENATTSKAVRTEYYELDAGADTAPYAVCLSVECEADTENGHLSFKSSSGDGDCETYHEERYSCDEGFSFNSEQNTCDSNCSNEELNFCLTEPACSAVDGFWWDEQCNATCPEDQIEVGGVCEDLLEEQITIQYPLSSTTVERDANGQTFFIQLEADDVSLRSVTINNIEVTSLFTQNGQQHSAPFEKLRGYLSDGSNTMDVTAVNSKPATVAFQANIASADVIITGVSSTDPLPVSGNASIQGVTRKTGLANVTVNDVDVPVAGKSFSGTVSVVEDVSAAASTADYTITATYAGGATSTVEMLANGRPVASALALQINNGAYGPITDWIGEAIEAEFTKDGCGTGEDTSDCYGLNSASIPKDFCELLFGDALGSTTTCESVVIIDGSQPLSVDVSLQSIPATIDSGAYAFDVLVTLKFDKLTTRYVMLRNGTDRLESNFVWDVDGPSNQNEPLVYEMKLRGSVVAPANDNGGSLFSLSFEDVDNCTGINDDSACTFGANFGAPAVSDTTCAEGNCSSITDDDIRGRLILASGEIVKTIVDVSKEALVIESWDGSQETYFEISAGTSDAEPIAEGSSIDQHLVSVPGSAVFTAAQNDNGAFIEIAAATAIANLDELTADDFHAVLGSRYTGSTSGFLTSDGKLGDANDLAIAISENALNQRLALQYASKQLDNLLTTIQGEDGLNAELNSTVGSNLIEDSELVFSSMSVPFITLNTDNTIRMTAQNIAMQINVDVGSGLTKALTAAIDIDVTIIPGVENGELVFSVDTDTLAIEIVDVQGFVVSNFPVIGDFDFNTIASDLKFTVLGVLPEHFDELISELGELALPGQTPFLFDVTDSDAEIPGFLTDRMPKVFGQSLAADGVSVEGSHLVLRGSLEDITDSPNSALFSLCLYSGEAQEAQCLPE